MGIVADPDKIGIPVGIYGSFNSSNKVYLDSLRDFLLCEEGFIPFISEDLARLCPRGKLSIDQYNLCISVLMTVVNELHVVYFFKSPASNPGINQSACDEIGYLSHRGSRHVYLLRELGSIKEWHTVFKGRLDFYIGVWYLGDFSRQKRRKAIGENVSPLGFTFCVNRRRDNPDLKLMSRNQFKDAVAKTWAEFLANSHRVYDNPEKISGILAEIWAKYRC